MIDSPPLCLKKAVDAIEGQRISADLFLSKEVLGVHDRQVVPQLATVTGCKGQAGATIATITRPRKPVPRLGHAHPGRTRLGSVELLSFVHEDVPMTNFNLITMIFPLATRVRVTFFPPRSASRNHALLRST